MDKNLRKKHIQTHIDYIYNLNYRETPVDIIKFISDDLYLGKSTGQGNMIYPFWKNALQQIFSDNRKLLILLTGAIGTGKSTIALYSIAYIMYRLLLLRDPWGYFNLANSGQMAVSFFNLNKTLGQSRGYSKLQTFLGRSEWFRREASFVSSSKGVSRMEFNILHSVLSSPYSQGFGVVGEDVVCGVMDEVDSPVAPLSQKEAIVQVYDATVRRFKDRFAPTGKSLGKVFLVASKQDEASFIDNFIETMRDKPEVLIFDAKLWDVKPKHIFSGITVPIAIGDAFKPSKVITPTEKSHYLKEGYRIIDVPEEFKFDFERDITGALRDLAGITVAGLRRRKLIASEQYLMDCFDPLKEDPIPGGRIEIGLNDDVELIEFVDVRKIRMPRSVQRFIHLDMSISGDASGISMAGLREWVQGRVTKEDGTFLEVSLPLIETDFSMAVKARPGDRIPLHKIRKFILDLVSLGFNIALVTADLLLLSEDTLQILSKANIPTGSLSLDKTNQPYLDFRNLVYEKRWVSHFHRILFTELKSLEQSPTSGKIDHPKLMIETIILPNGEAKENPIEGTKDLSDATAGAVYSCLTNNIAPSDLRTIREVFKRIHKPEAPIIEEVVNLPLSDSSGNTIIGIKEGEKMNSLLDIMKKRRGR